MTCVVFLGSEASAAGYRLAGAGARVPDAGGEAAAFAAARQAAALVIVEASIAQRLPPAQWRDAQAAVTPLVVIVPDLDTKAPMPDLASRLRDQLGLGEDT